MDIESNGDSPSSEEALTVAELCRATSQTLASLGAARVRGEIGDFFRSGAGHWYFNLLDQDAAAQISCVMFRGDNRRVAAEPSEGDQVLLRGRLDLYPPRGRLQLVARGMQIGDTGKLLRAFEALKAKLAAEGLFDAERKRPIPEMPRHVALITSGEGAALHDALSVFARRAPFIELSLLPTPVQGDAAPRGIVAALKLLARAAREMESPPQVALLARGGGSAEDLWAFNDEDVVRAVVACPLPIVSGIGHEIDFTLCDFAADCRAPTPSAAAEALSPDREELLGALGGEVAAMQYAMAEGLRRCDASARNAHARLRHPRERLTINAQRLDETLERITFGAWHQLERWQPPLARGVAGMRAGIAQTLTRQRYRWNTLKDALQLTNPDNVLRRGYAILSRDENVIHSSQQVEEGQTLQARLAEGALECRVEKKLAKRR